MGANTRGQVWGLPAPEVDRLLGEALEVMLASGEGSFQHGTFHRSDLREALLSVGAPEAALPGLESAFLRALSPEHVDRGEYQLPDCAEWFIKHRTLRLPAVRWDLPATVRLTQLLRGQQHLPSALRAYLERSENLLRSLRYPGGR